LSTLYVRPRDAADRRVLDNPEYATQILEETNIKKLVLIEDETTLVKLSFKPDAKKLGPRAGKYLKAIGQALSQADPKAVAKGGPYTVQVEGQSFELAPDEILTIFEAPENVKCVLEQGTFLALDTLLTPELVQEGLARDFNRLVQDQRKAMNLNISDRIAVSYSASPRIADAIATHEAYLRHELLADRLESSATQNGGAKLSLSGEDVFVMVTRV
jgi:isoleucyl-tRNA synthetase